MSEEHTHLGDVVIYRYSITELQVWKHLICDTTECPAVITKVWETGRVNLKLFNDGNGSFWVTLREQGDEPGKWRHR